MEQKDLEKKISEISSVIFGIENRLEEAEVRIKDLLGVVDGLGLNVTKEVSSATPTINTNRSDMHSITALAVDITSFTTNLSGSPVNGQKLIIRILDDGTIRAIAWGSGFRDAGIALPTTTVAGKLLTVWFVYDTNTSDWGCVYVANET